MDVSVSVKSTNHQTASAFARTSSDPQKMPISEVIKRIYNLNEGLRVFWSKAAPWAPIGAAKLLGKSRLDWQVQLSKTLELWVQHSPEDERKARLILAWANLGSLVEGTLKLFLSVWYETYKVDVEAIKKKDVIQDPDGLQIEPLRHFFRKRIWDDDFDKLIRNIQSRRNAIHAFKDRNIGTETDFFNALRDYLTILRYINFRLPYPDDIYVPREL